MMKRSYFAVFCLAMIWAAPGAQAMYHEKLPPEVLNAPVAKPTPQELEMQQRSARQVQSPSSLQDRRDEAVTSESPQMPPAEPVLAPAPDAGAAGQADKHEAKSLRQAGATPDPRQQPWSSKVGEALLVVVAVFFVMTMYGLFRSEKEKKKVMER